MPFFSRKDVDARRLGGYSTRTSQQTDDLLLSTFGGTSLCSGHCLSGSFRCWCAPFYGLDQRETLPRLDVLQAAGGRANQVALGPQHGTAGLQRLRDRVDTVGGGSGEEGGRLAPGVREQVAPRLRPQPLAGFPAKGRLDREIPREGSRSLGRR